MSYFKALERSERRKAEMLKKDKIAICIVTRGNPRYEFILSVVVGLMRPSDRYDLRLLMRYDRYSVTVGRNSAVRIALSDPDVTHLFWIDDDQFFSIGLKPAAALKMLYDVNQPIVSGITRGKLAVGNDFNYFPLWRYNDKGEGINLRDIDFQGKDIITVDGAGFNCVLIKREVFDKMKQPYFRWDDNNPQGQTVTEDQYFMDNARKLGYEIHVNTKVTLDHLGEFMLMCDGSIMSAHQRLEMEFT